MKVLPYIYIYISVCIHMYSYTYICVINRFENKHGANATCKWNFIEGRQTRGGGIMSHNKAMACVL